MPEKKIKVPKVMPVPERKIRVPKVMPVPERKIRVPKVTPVLAKKTKVIMPQIMIDVKQATQNAVEYLKSMFVGVTNIALEEMELTEDEQFWLITLSYSNPEEIVGMFKTIKIFKVRRDTGEVVAMKIRKI
ncbi:MAG: hypothetical protein AB1414_09335 [bacterium]